MNVFLSVFSGFLLLFWFGTAPASGESVSQSARVTFLEGRAEVLRKGESAWKSLQTGNRVSREDQIRTGGKSRLEITFPDRSILRFDQQTRFTLQQVAFDEKENSREIKTRMIAGRAWANVRRVFAAKKTFEVATSNAVAGVRDTVWRLDIHPDSSTLIRVYQGAVEVYNPFRKTQAGRAAGDFDPPREVAGPQEIPRPYHEVSREEWEEIVLSQMMQVMIPSIGRPGKPSPFAAEEDRREEWVLWNQERDQKNNL